MMTSSSLFRIGDRVEYCSDDPQYEYINGSLGTITEVNTDYDPERLLHFHQVLWDKNSEMCRDYMRYNIDSNKPQGIIEKWIRVVDIVSSIEEPSEDIYDDLI